MLEFGQTDLTHPKVIPVRNWWWSGGLLATPRGVWWWLSSGASTAMHRCGSNPEVCGFCGLPFLNLSMALISSPSSASRKISASGTSLNLRRAWSNLPTSPSSFSWLDVAILMLLMLPLGALLGSSVRKSSVHFLTTAMDTHSLHLFTLRMQLWELRSSFWRCWSLLPISSGWGDSCFKFFFLQCLNGFMSTLPSGTSCWFGSSRSTGRPSHGVSRILQYFTYVSWWVFDRMIYNSWIFWCKFWLSRLWINGSFLVFFDVWRLTVRNSEISEALLGSLDFLWVAWCFCVASTRRWIHPWSFGLMA